MHHSKNIGNRSSLRLRSQSTGSILPGPVVDSELSSRRMHWISPSHMSDSNVNGERSSPRPRSKSTCSNVSDSDMDARHLSRRLRSHSTVSSIKNPDTNGPRSSLQLCSKPTGSNIPNSNKNGMQSSSGWLRSKSTSSSDLNRDSSSVTVPTVKSNHMQHTLDWEPLAVEGLSRYVTSGMQDRNLAWVSFIRAPECNRDTQQSNAPDTSFDSKLSAATKRVEATSCALNKIKKKSIGKKAKQKESNILMKRILEEHPGQQIISTWCPKARRAWIDAMGCSTLYKNITHGGLYFKWKDTWNSKWFDEPIKITGWLRLDQRLGKMDYLLKKNLPLLTRPNLPVIQRTLNELNCMLIDPLMLKKHPDVVETVNRLTQYIGNCAEWNLSPEEELKFQVEAEDIRSKASHVYAKFRSLFPSSKYAKKSFQLMFMEEVEIFLKATEHMNEQERNMLEMDPVIFKPWLQNEDPSRINYSEDEANVEE